MSEKKLYRAARLRAAWIASHGPCRKCQGSTKLEIDHVDPALKTMAADRIWTAREELRIAELSNCQVLCTKCHWDKTRAERRYLGVVLTDEQQKEFTRLVLEEGYGWRKLEKLFGLGESRTKKLVNKAKGRTRTGGPYLCSSCKQQK